MAKAPAPTHDLLSKGFAERIIPLEARGIIELRSCRRVGAIGRIGRLGPHQGKDIERFAVRQGRGRELLVYTMERAARHLRSWRARGFGGTLHIPLPPQEMPDRTLATSFDIISRSQHIDQSAFTLIVPLKTYLERYSEVSNAMARISKVGCGVAMAIDCNHVVKFQIIPEHPFTGLMLSGKDVWRRLRTAGPGRLGALGSWIGWAESVGLKRTACGLSSAIDAETARAYGFTFGEGTYYSDFVPARGFISDDMEIADEAILPAAGNVGLPPRPALALRHA